ncbi:MAG TPA: hypothetical protein VGF75_03770, partial [Candidatus Saccharimonadales bacterium]
NVVNSILTETGSNTIVVGGDLDVGASGLGQLSVGVSSTVNGTIVVNNSSNTNAITIQQVAAPSSAVTLDLPTSSGTFAVSATGPLQLNTTTGALSCPSCDSSGGGGSSAVQSLDTDVGSLTLADSTDTTSTTITIQDASSSQLGLAEVNSDGNITATSGVLDTAQGIQTSSSPTFAGLTVQGSAGLVVGSTSNDGLITLLDGTTDSGHDYTQKLNQATLTGNQTITVPNSSGTIAVSASGNLSESATGNLTITNAPTFSTSVTTPALDGSSGLTISPGGTLTAGTTTDQFIVQGSSTSEITATSGSDTTTIEFDTPTATNAIMFPNAGGTVCLSSNNCSFAPSGSYILNQTSQQTSANIDIQSVASAVAEKVQGASGQNILNLYGSASSSTPVADFDGSGNLSAGTINGATINSTGINGSTITSTEFDGATLSGGTLSGGTVSGSTLTSTGLTFSGTTDSITGPTGSSITLDTTGSAALDLGNTNATTINLGNSNSATTLAGTFNEAYSTSSANTVNSLGVTNNNSTGAGVSVQGLSLTPLNKQTPTSGTNTLNVVNFAAASNANGASDTTNGINFASATGYTNFIDTPTFVLQSSGNITGAGTYDSATISGGSLSSTTVDGLGVSSTAITATGALQISSTGGSNAITLSSGSGNIST